MTMEFDNEDGIADLEVSLEGLIRGGTEVSTQEILNTLMDGEHNLKLKTEIVNPRRLSVLKLYILYFDSIGAKTASFLLSSWIEEYMLENISHRREGRKEIVSAIGGIMKVEQELSTREKLTSNLRSL